MRQFMLVEEMDDTTDTTLLPDSLTLNESETSVNKLHRRISRGLLSDERFLALLVFLFLAGLIASLVYLAYRNDRQTEYVAQTSHLVMLTQRIAKEASNAVLGHEPAFEKLENSSKEFSTTLTALVDPGSGIGFQPLPDYLIVTLHKVTDDWSETEKNVQLILDQKQPLLQARSQVNAVNDASPELVERIDELVELLLSIRAKRSVIKTASRMGMLGQRLIKNINLVLPGGARASGAVALFSSDIAYFEKAIKQLRSSTGKSLKNRLDRLEKVFKGILQRAKTILSYARQIFIAQNADQAINNSSDALVYKLVKLKDGYARANSSSLANYLPWLFSLGSLLSLLRLIRVRLTLEAAKAKRQQMKNQRTQRSITTLLDKVSSLADGDLTIKPEVNDSATGAIADAVSFAVQEMRYLVARIQQAAKQITTTSDQSQEIAEDLSNKAGQQASQIVEVAAYIQDIARSMESMSSDAKQSAEVALQSVSVAKKGATSVQATIDGMAAMRSQMQTTSKRIKRLGESSQQIGDIVALINELSDQTNVLSVNASIQAAMAGEAGRGFSVVVDEVQQLAERSSQGARQITDILKHIRSDTSSAVKSMEEATRGVVESTRLADQAGSSLVEIQRVSERLAQLITEISKVAHKHSASAMNASEDMTTVKDITIESAANARKVADMIERLTELAKELQKSVSRFKLPKADVS
ncbi:MAG: hypothetical protein DSZ33_02080 [Gammaproteobacteria bacterium]|nr:MAG: hypothetical protein DSZ33_02080 [Gammaproteobacteria bacterium]